MFTVRKIAYGPLTSINQTCSVQKLHALVCVSLGSAVTK